ncbi:YkvA family protein [Paenibacillus antri]|uniref:YkvA family protein n=1 Tax=Paenibacillus antri TaxID=2582848 RepID=UPI001EE4840A|nr:DUF1232 domain-containing protein [Paenibacillus antri]
MDKLRAWAKRLKRQLFALYLAARRPDTPWYAKATAAAVVAYAFSPIDLIPDFIPVLGLLDDIVLVPLGVWLALRLVPDAVLRECREEAERRLAEGGRKPVSRVGALFVCVVWIVCAAALAWWAIRRL